MEIYGGGWLLTHFFMFDKARAGQLDGYLSATAQGKPGIEAARAAFGPLAPLQDELAAYLRKPLYGWVIPAAKVSPGAITVRKLTDGEAAIMPARLRSMRGVDARSSGDVRRQMERLAGPYRDDPAVQAALAEAECDDEAFDACAAAADRALQADPKNVDALLYRGRAKIGPLTGKNTNAAEWSAARAWFVRANRLDPWHAGALADYYDSFRLAGQLPTANAVDGLHQAFVLAPEDNRLRLLVTADYLRRGDRTAARATLAPLAFGAHRGMRGSVAALLLNRLDKGDDAGVLAKDIWTGLDKRD